MNRSQAYALAHPLDYAGALDLSPYRIVKRHGGTGLLLQAILAVDR